MYDVTYRRHGPRLKVALQYGSVGHATLNADDGNASRLHATRLSQERSDVTQEPRELLTPLCRCWSDFESLADSVV